LRIKSINIRQWRNFENIDLQLDADAGLVCIVGANGTGKSHLLELVGACAHRLGLSQGVEIPRGDPFSDQHEFSLTFFLSAGVSPAVEKFVADQGFIEWDRTLTVQSKRLAGAISTTVEGGGITDQNRRTHFAGRIVELLGQSQSVHFVSLDADRSYPKKNIHINEIAQAYQTDWEGAEYTRGRSFKMTATLYDEWIKYLLAQENQAGTRLIQDTRRARKAGTEDPIFDDHFKEFSASLQKVLPHVLFTGVEPKAHTITFDTTGLQLTFNQLSGGEREIAFLVGQIDRFGLRQGLFLLDEPELHLNADLIRAWISYLTSTIETGQIWLATHSLEAAESAGPHATFVLERNEETRKVDSLARLDTRPVLSALSRAVGTPAFSISKLLFVFIEGEEGVGEREQYNKLAGSPQNVRFMEGGSCNDVIRRVTTIKSLASESQATIRIGGIVDRDFRSAANANSLGNDQGVFVLPVHEKENFFLHPSTLTVLLQQNGRTQSTPADLIREAADTRAGSWIFQNAMASPNAKSLPAILTPAKARAKNQTWAEIVVDQKAAFKNILDVSGYNVEDQSKLQNILEISANSYASKRPDDSLWKVCEGKQVLNDVAHATGFAGVPDLIQATFVAWIRNETLAPEELKALRAYLTTL
jgi:AAA domain, putative AbiEii toxin, Type IV TA system/Protein of unknown function (DUF4435)